MITSETIDNIHNNIVVQKFLADTNFIHSNNKKVIGVSLVDQGFILKYYIELKRENNEFDVKDIIGTKYKFYKKLLPFVDFNKHSCLAVGLKITDKGEIQKYLHFKLKNIKLKSKSYKLKFMDFSKCEYGYSIEYNGKTKRKKYFYFKDRESKEYIKKMFNLKVDTDTISHFETYQTQDILKINIVFDIFREKQITKKFLIDNNLAYTKPIIAIFNTFFKKEPVYLGIDNKKTISFYYNFNEL
jgi:hypothetical protein